MVAMKECGCPIKYDLLLGDDGDWRPWRKKILLGKLLEKIEVQTCVTGHALDMSHYPYCLDLSADGVLTIHPGFVWDFGSGPAIDTPDVVRASIAHDVFCDLVNTGKLPKSCRKIADQDYYKALRAYGMGALRARIQYIGVRIGAWL